MGYPLALHLQVKQIAADNGLCSADFADDQHAILASNLIGVYFTCSEDAGHEGIHRDVFGIYEARGPQPEEEV